MIRRAALALAGAVALATGVHFTRQTAAAAPAPSLSTETARGERVTLESLRGKRVVLEFFAVWCPECRRDVVRLGELESRSSGRPVEVLAVALEGKPADVESAVREAGGAYRVAVADAATGARFGVTRFPTRFLIDEEGRLLARDADFSQILKDLDR